MLPPREKRGADRLGTGASPQAVMRAFDLSPADLEAMHAKPEFAERVEAVKLAKHEKIGESARRYARTAFRTGRHQGGRR